MRRVGKQECLKSFACIHCNERVVDLFKLEVEFLKSYTFKLNTRQFARFLDIGIENIKFCEFIAIT